MNCSKANDYFMKYMDGSLSEDEAGRLNKHLENCDRCAEDFYLYDSLLISFSNEDLIEAPEGFEIAVMAEIEKLPPVYARVDHSIDKILWVVIGLFTMFLGFGFAVFMNRDLILTYMAGSESLSVYVDMLKPVSDFVSEFMGNVGLTVSNAISTVSAFIGAYKYFVLGAAVVLFGIQFILYRKDKVEE